MPDHAWLILINLVIRGYRISSFFYRLTTSLKCALYRSEGAFTVFLILITKGYLHKYSLSHYPDTVDRDCLCHTGLVFACIVHKASA